MTTFQFDSVVKLPAAVRKGHGGFWGGVRKTDVLAKGSGEGQAPEFCLPNRKHQVKNHQHTLPRAETSNPPECEGDSLSSDNRSSIDRSACGS